MYFKKKIILYLVLREIYERNKITFRKIATQVKIYL